MKQLFTLVFVLFTAFHSQAQSWFPVGATFTFTKVFEVDWGYPPIPILWTVRDTVIKKGKMCKELGSKPSELKESRTMLSIYVYDSNSVVYWYRPHLDSFTVLYDFNKNVGETWNIFGVRSIRPLSDTIGCTLTARVKEKNTVIINGFPLRRMRIEIDPFIGSAEGFSGEIIEYVGHLQRPRPDPFYACEAVSESGDFFGLRCFDHPDIGFHDFKLVPYCDYVPTSINEFNATQDLNISPNPATDFFDFKYQNKNKAEAILKVYNLLGQQIWQQNISEGNNKIDGSNWIAGAYYYQLHQEGNLITAGKLLKQ